MAIGQQKRYAVFHESGTIGRTKTSKSTSGCQDCTAAKSNLYDRYNPMGSPFHLLRCKSSGKSASCAPLLASATPVVAAHGFRALKGNFRKSGGGGLNVPTGMCTLMYTYRAGCRWRTPNPHRPLPRGGEVGGALWRGRIPLVLNPRHLNSTQTPFLHREGRVESGGAGFNRQEASGGLKGNSNFVILIVL